MVAPELRALDDTPADLLVLVTFADERPLEGLTGLVDWRLCGAISSWKLDGLVAGAYGEQLLYPTNGRLSHPRLLLLGLGRRAEHRSDRAFAVARQVLATAAGLAVTSLTIGLLGLDQLASPLERTGSTLVSILREASALQRVSLVADPKQQRLVKEGIAFYTSRA